MSQCVPNWDLSEPPPSSAAAGVPPFQSSSAADDVVPLFEYEVAELTWENGQLSMHGLGLPRVTGKIQNSGGGGGVGSKYTWDNKPARASGTLESLVNQGTRHGKSNISFDINNDDTSHGGANDLVPWFSDNHRQTPTASTADAMVPCDGEKSATAGGGGDKSSEIPVAARKEDEDCRVIHGKRGRVVARVVQAEGEWSSCRNQISVSGNRESGQKVTLNSSRDRNFVAVDVSVGFTSTTPTSQGSLDNTSSDKPCVKNTTVTTTDDHDSVCHSTHQDYEHVKVEEEDEGDRKKENAKSSVSTKRSRAAAIHNQSERKRRDKINQRMKTLQKLVPNSNKTDKASMLDEVIEYLKQLQAQVQMMSRMNMPMMLQMAMQQQLSMAPLMAPMGLGMGMGGMGMPLGMDHLNMIAGRSGLTAGMSPLLHPTAFMPIPTWDGGACDQLQQSPTTMVADPFSAFLACQQQPMTMEAHKRIATMFQQLHQHTPTVGGSKN